MNQLIAPLLFATELEIQQQLLCNFKQLTITQPTTQQTTTEQTTTQTTTTTSNEPITTTSTSTSTSQTTEPITTTPQTTEPFTTTSIATPSSSSPSTSTTTTTPSTTSEPAQHATQQDHNTNTSSSSSTTTKTPKILEPFPYTCPLCLEEFESRKDLYRVVGCRHLYCQKCVVTYYSQSIVDHKPKVKCPTPACQNEILFCNVKNLLDGNALIKYQRIALKVTQNQNKGSIWCPGENCKTKIGRQKSKNLDTNSIVVCPTCKLRVCFKCGEWEHTGVVCDEAEQLTDKKIESEKATKQAFENWKKESGVVVKGCPKCFAVIERNGGCSHMTCRACMHQFCFVCLVPTRSTHCSS